MKLNLVPDYVRQRKVSKRVVAMLTLLFIAVNALMVFWLVSVQAQLAALQQRKSELELQAQQVDNFYNQANQMIDSAALLLGLVEWAKRVQQHNLRYPELYSQVSQYTSPRVRYASMQVVQGNQLQLAGFTRSIRDLGLFLQAMYQCPLFTAVSLTSASLPGYSTGGTQQGVAFGFGTPGGSAPATPAAPVAAGVVGASVGGAPPAPSAPSAPPAFGVPGGGFGAGFTGRGTQAMSSPANLMPFQVVAYLKEPITLPVPPANVPGLNLGSGSGFGMSIGGFGGTAPMAPPGGGFTPPGM
ncbi:MAG: hypothetical protein NZ550_03750 [Fimbriimonadales bacterium]|nr:hypothetical protein [Fimbriimonadales bacterium]MDW8050977.1 hypothetical protein [Armatimonadota bacterium]